MSIIAFRERIMQNWIFLDNRSINNQSSFSSRIWHFHCCCFFSHSQCHKVSRWLSSFTDVWICLCYFIQIILIFNLRRFNLGNDILRCTLVSLLYEQHLFVYQSPLNVARQYNLCKRFIWICHKTRLRTVVSLCGQLRKEVDSHMAGNIADGHVTSYVDAVGQI